MKAGHRKQFGFPFSNPVLPVFPLHPESNRETVAVSAAVIADTHCATFGASIHMPAKVCSPAAFQCGQCPQLPAFYLRMLLHFCPVLTHHLGHFEARFHFLNK